MTIADAHYTIGKTHEVCQDYAIAEDDVGPALVVVCDGCSSSPNTDWGARFLARAAAQSFDPFDPFEVIRRADHYRKSLELHPHALDATLLRAKETPTGDAEVNVCGDGVIVARRRDGSGYDHWNLSFSHNAPAYLSYLLDADRLAAYQQAGGGLLQVQGCPLPQVPFPDAVAPVPVGIYFRKVFSRVEYDVVLVMTDGATSFQRLEGTRYVPVPLEDVIAQVLDFKTLTHGFLRRRIGRFLTKFCPQNGWQHYDDFSVAGLVLDPPKETP